MAEGFNELVRIGGAEIQGKWKVYHALTRIKGVSYSMSNAICKVMNLDKGKQIGYLSNEDTRKIEETLKNHSKGNLKQWMLNRRNDYETGEDKHLISTDIDFVVGMDKKRMQKTKSWKGLRLSIGLPVRGQRTRSHFRKGKSIGVSKKKARGKKT